MNLTNEQQKAVDKLRACQSQLMGWLSARNYESHNEAVEAVIRELEQAQRERDEAIRQCDGWRLTAEENAHIADDRLKDRDDLRAKLLASEAGNAEMRENYQDLRNFVRAVCLLLQRHRGATEQEMDRMFQTSYKLYTKHGVERPLPTTCGQSFLDERERQRELLAYVRENVTVEVAAHGDCSCDIPAGDTPCVYCAAIHFNERTDAQGAALQPK